VDCSGAEQPRNGASGLLGRRAAPQWRGYC
jgi:hypothetical protein